MKKAIFILIIFYLINLIYAANLGISPSSIEFYLIENEKACSNITLFSNIDSVLIGEDSWSLKSNLKKDIKEYTIKAEDLGIILEYPLKVEVKDKKDIEVCIIAEKEGEYYGALVYSVENKPAAVGTWIYADIQGKKSINKITGAFLGNINPNISQAKALLFTLTIFLLLIFLFLLKISKKRKYDYLSSFSKQL